MEVMVLEPNDGIELLRTIGEEWAGYAAGNPFGINVDVSIGIATMNMLKNSPSGDVLVLVSGGEVKGFMGLTYAPNHIGAGIIANECCFFVTQSARGGGLKLIHAAEKLAKSKGCQFLTLNASRVAGNADRSGKLYEHCGYAPLETAYLKAL